jgi:hypothetical protein
MKSFAGTQAVFERAAREQMLGRAVLWLVFA